MTRDDLEAAILQASVYVGDEGTSGYLLWPAAVNAILAAADKYAGAAVAGAEARGRAAERERVAGLLDEASKAIMTQAVSLVSEGNEADGLPKVQMAASVGLAASLVRGKVPQQVSDLLPPGVLPGGAPESAP